jgi:queuosine precursor transporter
MDTRMDKGEDTVRMRGLAVGIAAMVVIVTGSNIAVQYPINDWLTWGALTYPVSFLVTDLTNRILGPGMARRVVYVGFAVAVTLSVALATWRIALASGAAFLLAQLLDIAIFDRLRRAAWWQAPFVSSLLASALDTAVFFTLAFAAAGLPWVTWGLGDYGVKLGMALILLMPFRALMSLMLPIAPSRA